ncbi:uncharacterized protein B0P05DRAFT_574815 [Gilbertella persicaria]|uniref:Uncharacterized protein n=1 Tax=Rhizopus stolonifer TaxID=4846 RepID=A0A367K0W7_RHIST|nr:uncharacterized protein B0P05DRAFT_574815 [Gilbertella persicaria]KAI8059943.1 hypothetical protein B0P05DRAFT_574815 [Gilbertella persicaria]RCH95820.1 hypothetical protein CU098_005020 [Rhizopus stolonifer]
MDRQMNEHDDPESAKEDLVCTDSDSTSSDSLDDQEQDITTPEQGINKNQKCSSEEQEKCNKQDVEVPSLINLTASEESVKTYEMVEDEEPSHPAVYFKLHQKNAPKEPATKAEPSSQPDKLTKNGEFYYLLIESPINQTTEPSLTRIEVRVRNNVSSTSYFHSRGTAWEAMLKWFFILLACSALLAFLLPLLFELDWHNYLSNFRLNV